MAQLWLLGLPILLGWRSLAQGALDQLECHFLGIQYQSFKKSTWFWIFLLHILWDTDIDKSDRKWPPSHSHTSCIITPLPCLPCVVNMAMGYEKMALVHVRHIYHVYSELKIANPQTPTPNYTHNSPNWSMAWCVYYALPTSPMASLHIILDLARKQAQCNQKNYLHRWKVT
jgi:hypothetical protein